MAQTDPQRVEGAVLESGFAGDEGVAVTPHHLATDAAVAILRQGGNAVDAAIAANAVLGVVAPDTCGPGGDLFALVHIPGDDRPLALNASGRAGSRVDAETLRQRGLRSMPLRSPETVTVPGCVDGWEALVERVGTRPLPNLLEPAIDLATNGFATSPELASTLTYIGALIGGTSAAQPLYPGDTAPEAGDVLTRPDLARTLRAIADGGREAFYGGEAGAGITVATEGMVTPDDLAITQAEWVAPIGIPLHGLHGWTLPPNSQGYLTLAALWIADEVGAGTDPGDPVTQHLLIESFRAAAWDRDDVVTDPGTAPLDPESLLDPERLRRRTAVIDPGRVADWPLPSREPGGTAFLCVRDGSGLGVSLIQSNFHGVGSGLVAGDTGVFLHNRGAGFTLTPGHPNELHPGRRPLHTLSPTLWTSGSELRLLLGTRGGRFQPQILLQVASHHLRGGRPLAEAIAGPRWVLEQIDPAEPPVVLVESRMGPEVVDGLRRCGQLVSPSRPWERDWGPVSAIEIDAGGGTAAADPRVETAGVGVASAASGL